MGKRPCLESPKAGDEHHDISASTDCVAALSKDIFLFATHKQVPKGLGPIVCEPEEIQAAWYEELSVGWKELDSKPTPEEAAELVFEAFQRVYIYGGVDLTNLKDFLHFYGLPHYLSLKSLTLRDEASPVAEDAVESPLNTPESRPRGYAQMDVEDNQLFLLETLPVSGNRVKDGCCFTVFVEVKDLHILPSKTLFLIIERRRALANGDECLARQLLEQINNMEDYGLTEINNVEVVTRKYDIKLRGIDAHRGGIEVRDKLVKIINGKCLTIVGYYLDDCMRCVGDVYCDGFFLQQRLFKELRS